MTNAELTHEKLTPLKYRTYKPERFPVSVYRLQFNSAFTFRDAARIVPYLHDLGITDCYASPYFKTRRGSRHGYDISDQNSLNPEVGSPEEYLKFVNRLQSRQMGQILDFVPNHMSIFDNPKWQNVLENGPSSPYARFFDIDWDPVKTELHQKVLLPILEDLYGLVLESGLISIVYIDGSFLIQYREHRLPIDLKTLAPLLETGIYYLKAKVSESSPNFLEMESIITACKNLPERSDTRPESMATRQRENEAIKKRLQELVKGETMVLAALEKASRTFNGVVSDSQSFIRLHELLEKQAYRLSFWRVAAEEINYRRFFDVNELVALRMEDPIVFAETHQLVSQLFARRKITGIRIDHVDGLYDPADYLSRLQRICWLELMEQQTASSKADLVEQIDSDLVGISPADFYPAYIVVEKILGENETVNREWPVKGTTGYEFIAQINPLYIDEKQGRKILKAYRWFTGFKDSFSDTAYRCKNLVMSTTMAGEVNLLAHHLSHIAEKSWRYRDFTLNTLRDAIREVIACFPVYRTYVKAHQGSVDENDRNIIEAATADAKRRSPAINAAIFHFIRDTLLLQYPAGMDEAGCEQQRLFVMRFQQLTGPVMAKGVEDTAFYVYNPLVSQDEVGSNPRKLRTSLREFHKKNILRRQSYPHSFIATSTHDSKRSEDVRARINVLSEMPADWRSALSRWRRFNMGKKIKINNEPVPDGNEEYLLYQTLLGTYPLDEMTDKDFSTYRQRIQNYMLKAIKEAKVHTSWINPDPSYEEGVTRFVEMILSLSSDNPFLADFKILNQITGICGIYNSLSQAVLKLFSPGVPDIYQGNELWAYNLTDPDNRNPVDYERHIRLLNELKKQVANKQGLRELTRALLKSSHDGRIKLYVTWKSLNFRRNNKALFEGIYWLLKARGAQKDHLCAFAWESENSVLIVAVPRLLVTLTGKATIYPLGQEVWKDTQIIIPGKLRSTRYRNIFTGEILEVQDSDSHGLFLAEVFKSFPVAVLESVEG